MIGWWAAREAVELDWEKRTATGSFVWYSATNRSHGSV